MPGWVLFFSAVVWAVQIAAPAKAQAPVGASALGDAAAAQARAQRFLSGRTAVRAGAAATVANTAEQMGKARAQHAAMPHAVPAGAGTANLSAAWQPLGPMAVSSLAYGAISGRITSIAADPNDSTGNTVWLGTTGGGVWKSTDAAGPVGSVSFAPLTDSLPVFAANSGAFTVPSLSIGAVAVQPATTAVVLAGTGDPNDAADSYYGEGILRSADGGQTWTLAHNSHDGANGNHSFAGLATAGLAWSTATPTLVVAAMSVAGEGSVIGAAGATSVPGLYFSTDAGVTWQMASVYDGAQLVQAPRGVGSMQGGNSATAVVWDAQRQLFIAALSSHGYYSSPDGQTWTRLAHQPGVGLSVANCPVGVGGIGSPNCPIFRGALAVQPATGDLYALTVDANNIDQGLWQDVCDAGSGGACASPSPTFATRLDGGALEAGQGAAGGSTAIPQGSYDLALAAAPAANGGTVLLAGTVDLYRCSLSAGGNSCTFRNTTNAGDGCNAPAMVAPAQHALVALAQSSGQPILFLGNDGGLWRSLDGVAETGAVCSATDASHFDNLNGGIAKGGSLAEVVGFAEDPQVSDRLIAGLGADGSAATATASALTNWPQMSAGEGGYPQLDPQTPSNWYVAIGAGVNLKLCDVGQACGAGDFLFPSTVGETQVQGDQALLDAPTLLDPQSSSSLLAGTCRVWRGPAQTSAGWSAANALSAAMDGSGAPCSAASALIRSLGAGGPVGSSASVANSGSEVLYAGMAGAEDGGGTVGGHVFVAKAANTANSTTRWTDAAYGTVLNGYAAFNAQGFDISSVVADAHDATGATVYVSVMGFGTLGGVAPHVYRSTDFGGHWTDVSANLPNAPANSLVVDPNDANTVYVAMDTGVYVTQGITTCATANCWSPLGTGLPNAPVTQLQAGEDLPTGDGRVGMLRAATYGRGLWQTPLLTAAVPVVRTLVASPSSLSFASQAAGTESAAQTVTLTSTGNAPVTISSLVMAGDFVESDTCAGQTLAVGASCAVSAQFAPTAAGTRLGSLTVYGNVAGGQVTVPLSGTATGPAAIVLTPGSLSFASTTVNQSTAVQIVTLSNTGGVTATLTSETVTGDFSIVQNTCGATLASQTGCSISIKFTPTASGTRNGVLTVVDSVGTQMAQLSGVGQSPATDTLAPSGLSFAQQQVGTTSAVQQVTLTNAGDMALTLITASATGDFAATNACGSSLAPHSACAISVAFVPTATGTRTGTLTVTDMVRSQTVSLSGTGVAPPGVSLTPTTLSFGATGVGLNSPVQTLTLTNNGGLALAIASTAVTGDFAVASSTCGATLNVGSACSFVLFFAPSAAGQRTGSLVLTDNASGGTQTVALSGTGIDFSLSPNGATTVSIASGATATFPLQLNSVAGLSGNVALSCSGAPANSVCTVSPATAALGGNVLVSVVVQTATATAEGRPWPMGPRKGGGGLLVAGLPLACLGLCGRRRSLSRAARRVCLPLACCGVLVSAVSGLAGCGAARVIPYNGPGGGGGTGTSGPTPSGTYAITVTGATAGVTHTVGLTLTVQ